MNNTPRAALASLLCCAAGVCCAVGPASQAFAQQVAPATAAPGAATAGTDHRLDWWNQTRFGMFIHFGLYSTFEGKWKDSTNHAEWIRDTAKIPLDQYEQQLPKFNPTKFDAKAIAKAAKDAGMGYICITTKHHDGFSLFDSKLTEWDVMSTPYGKDIMKQLAEACREEGIRMCWYYSIMDWHHPDYIPRRPWESRSAEGADFDKYVTYMKGQLKELLTGYGPIGVLWFDGQWEHNWNNTRGEDLYKYVRSLQPDIIINSRVGRAGGDYGLDRASGMLGDYATPEQTIPEHAIRDQPWETCMTMNGNWGFNAADHNFKSATELVQKLADIAGKGGNFLLNIGPTAEGAIPGESAELLKQIGAWMKVNAESIKGTIAGPFDSNPWGACTMRPHAGSDSTTRLYLHVFKWPKDGVVRVPGLLNEVVGATVLGGAPVSKFDNGDGAEVVLHCQAAAANAHDTVISLEIKGAPDVASAPTFGSESDMFVGRTAVKLASSQANVEIRYTKDGSVPTAQSPVGSLVSLTDTTELKARSFRGDRAVSPVASAKYTNVKPLPPVGAKAEPKPGVHFDYYEAEFKKVADMDSAKPVSSGDCSAMDLKSRKRDLNFAFKYTGYISAKSEGVYHFYVSSDDGSTLMIDGKMVVDNDTPHSFRERRGDVALAAGLHAFELRFFENTGGFSLKAEMQGPGLKREDLKPLVSEAK
jgi:alpha-L-fucosidase